MKGYFINSDAVSNKNHSYHSEWITRGIAVTSGGPEYLQQIDTIPQGSTILLHAKGYGVVAAGTVLDERSFSVKQGAGTVSPLESEEFHRTVAWYADLRTDPLPYKDVIRVWGTNPVRAVQSFEKSGDELLELVHARAEEADVAALAAGAPQGVTEVETLVQARRGQGRYREALLALWQGRCAVTGCALGAVLRASHARPWCRSTDAQRLDPNNGLPLIATLDALFDRGLIGFSDQGAMLYSSVLTSEERRLLGVPAPLRLPLNPEQKQYLKDHRQAFALRDATNT
ncbi:HNH endonuclease [Cystobacter fuscus]|uniref:HNH endonuclease n=1 Tax=Cystobacter fuscus TaxID=43 RepID=UPI002B311EE0|nr:HNH endonuclease [Cystobacter fuscus]